ncbi:uncharacterized protein DUF4292 [Oceanihabitans sediminis]|uniref:DUF4292 domain-containing protein n=1 Tax=Oceanihabitans sediminis TaxID=1812012 RepID=A0A368P6Y1_9FLAO|nr:DUF4292 domain-containing protein [Oceanihabitans sediminis]RBP34632.1 uncharacterized protein DUF4292 [Oceanihabitans sediminis]RCU58288.1 DUF4292 domain-containing protein [Oceanihabitans sediminis]
MQLKRVIYILSFVVLLFGCKSSKTVATGEGNLNLSAKQLIKAHLKSTPDFETLAGRLKIDYTEGSNSKSTTVSFRMEKDQVIWISKLGIIKALITPTRVAFYNNWDNTYFDGNYAYLSDLMGIELDFNKVQNLLLGEALYSLKEDDFEVQTLDDQYILKPKTQSEALELFYLLNASHFKMNSQQLAQAKELRMLQIDYTSYQKVDKQTFPETIKIHAVEANEETNVNLEFRSLTLNSKLSFPFRIPSGYEEIVLK